MTAVPNIHDEEEWSRRLRQLVDNRVKSLDRALTTKASERRAERLAYEEASQQLKAHLEAEGQRIAEETLRSESSAEAHWSRQLAELDATTSAAIQQVEHRYQTERTAAESSRDETTWLVGSLLDEGSTDSPRQQLQRLHLQMDGNESVLQEAVRSAETLRENAAEYLERCRLSTEVGLYEPEPPPTSLSALQERCLEEVQLVEGPYRQLRKMWLPKCFAGFTPVLIWLGLAAVLALPTWWFVPPELLKLDVPRTDTGWVAILSGSAAAISLVVLLMMHLTANQRAFVLITEVFVHSRAAQALFARWQRLAAEELASAQQDLDRRHGRRKQQHDSALTNAHSEFHERMSELEGWRTAEIERLNSSSMARRNLIEEGQETQLQQLREANARNLEAFQDHQRNQIEFLDTHHVGRELEIDSVFEESRRELTLAWTAGLAELTEESASWEQAVRPLRCPWDDLNPATSATDLRYLALGHFQIGLSAIDKGLPEEPELAPSTATWELPALVDLNDRPALLLQFRDVTGRQAAVQLLQTAILRLLATLPAGQVRLTILDPLSLGENFATFMHLADVDELLINTRIWTEPGQIEERLADLTEHMETVLQNFLRNEFATLEAYNREAGEVAEPYRVLVVSGLPHGFSDIAVRRLWNIVTSGARCGVIPLIAVDTQMTLPRGFLLEDLQPHVHVLNWEKQEFHWQNPEMRKWPLIADPPPEPARFGELVKQFGQQAGDVRRVEVPFSRVAPPADAIWTESSAKQLIVPIGRAGASRTQAVALGLGTSQHVLIAGKTGSGKSSLLHAFITNAALHYGPDELAMYLIDFKKGVEFKVYSRHRLPHARVVGIESDREFGVSALERLDWELQERSSLFRDAGVADLAGFRKARPDHPLPRILLIIDEFQEFFVDDDSLSQTAALLLDRLIRQGRAFGVHVVLGSQTLAGAYSLARSTLGQVAVRIALQCSETDAHLILSEENTAARLLTRPGEAIYNDANGLTTGNHLFQVVWLDDQERDGYLEIIQEHSERTGYKASPAIVFEGNVPADLMLLPSTSKAADKPSRTAGINAWLGESVSLRGPLGLEFVPASGSHLVVVGQDEASALGITTAAVISVATRSTQVEERLQIFNGSPQETATRVWDELGAALPQVEMCDFNELDSTLTELANEVRQRDGRPGPNRWLVLFDLVRFRKLRRKEDDYGFGGFDKKEASPSDLLAEILRDGPSVGIHVWIWCDSTNTMSRWLSREMQQHLENRVALAMNASDSSTLIDSPAASRLGANRAWLFRGDRGTLDKFRPYSVPLPGKIGELIRSRLDGPHIPQ